MEIIAHRGLTTAAPENTTAGLAACIEHGLRWAEVDVRRGHGSEYVLGHDELMSLTPPLPRLSEALQVARGCLGLYLDCRDVDPVELLAEIGMFGTGCQTLLTFDAPVPAALTDNAPDGVRRVAYWDGRSAGLEATIEETGCAVVEMFARAARPELLDAAHGMGVQVGCITLREHDCREWWLRCQDLGADWIMTDKPLEARDAIAD